MTEPLSYCAIKSKFCKNRNPSCPANSTFFAYAFEPPFFDVASELADYLKGISVETRIPNVSNLGSGLLFCDIVCPMILESDIVVGEVSSPNRNVTLEIGYAVGAGKRVILFQNEKFGDESNPFFQSGLYVNKYSTTGSIAHAIAKGKPKVLLDLNREISEEKDTACVLVADEETQQRYIQVEITEALNEKGLRLVQEAGDGLEYHQILRTVQASEWVIAMFVGDNYRNHAILNARVAFFLGAALALGKKIVVLQQMPEQKMMVDLAGVVERYTNPQQIRNILLARLDHRKTRVLDRSAALDEEQVFRGLMKNTTTSTTDADGDVLAAMGAMTNKSAADISSDDRVQNTAETADTQNQSELQGDFNLSPGETPDDDSQVIQLEDDSDFDGDLVLDDDSGELELADDEFLLTPSDGTSDGDEGSQVIALEDAEIYDDSSSSLLDDELGAADTTTEDESSRKSFWRRLFGQ